jgi:TonB family protein
LHERIDLLVVDEKKKAGSISLAIGVSLVLHALLLVWFVRSYQPVRPAADVPIARYVELIRQNPEKEFVEAPGPKTDTAPMTAPLSDANRKASGPNPTGDQPTKRPGDGSGLFTPPMPRPGRAESPRAAQQASPAAQQQTADAQEQQQQPAQSDALTYREPQQPQQAAAGPVDWRSAIRDVRKVASLGGSNGFDINGATGGDKGFFEQGPLSFETQWYDWGEYAQSMVSRIRVNWYANMPQLIRTGMQGVVTIRFTIHRDGRISDITTLKSSGVPPYDHAARKAIELSSPLNALPKDFPNSSERVTCMFYYNMQVPNR